MIAPVAPRMPKDFFPAGYIFQISTKWSTRRGISHGLQQSAVLIDVLVLDTEPHKLEAARQKFKIWSKPPNDALDEMEICSPSEVITAWAQTVINLQRELGQAIDHRTKVWQVVDTNAPAGWLTFKLLMPSPTPSLTIKVAGWLLSESMQLNATADSRRLAKEKLFEDMQRLLPRSVNSESIADAALRLGIPNFRIPDSGGTQVLGLGSKARWLNSTKSHTTSGLGLSIAKSKQLTATILRTCGLPGATHKFVQSADDAIYAANELGFPVVVKPENLERGVGVQADLIDSQSVRTAYELARKHSERILVERHCPGYTHRISVFNRRIVRVSRRIPGGVMGDGRSTIRELVRVEQQAPHQIQLRLRNGHSALEFDEEALGLLRQEQLTPDDIPANQRYVRLRRRDNINAGGKNELVPLDRVHADNIELSLTVADLLGLDFAGIDLITPDIGQSWRTSSALICEVNGVPQLGTGSDADTYLHILQDMFPDGWRIPTSLVIVPEDRTLRMQERDRRLVFKTGYGIADCSGLILAGKSVSTVFADGYASAQALLIRPDVSDAVCLMSPKEILKIGTPLTWWDSVDITSERLFTHEERELLTAAQEILSPHYKV